MHINHYILEPHHNVNHSIKFPNFLKLTGLQSLKMESLKSFMVQDINRGGSRTAATSKIELFVIIVNGFEQLTIITKCFILDVAAVLDLPLLQNKSYEDLVEGFVTFFEALQR